MTMVSAESAQIMRVTGEFVAVFDIGGTWFRSGLVDARRRLVDADRSAAVNYLDYPELSAGDLQQRLVDFIVERVRHYRRKISPTPLNVASLSLGAAINGHTGEVLNSGPLWGPACAPFDLLTELRTRDPRTQWVMANDVTAGLLRYVADSETEPVRKVMLITVSSGIGSRIYDATRDEVPLDPLHGVQGEIGHVPIEYRFDGNTVQRACDCGGSQHLNAYSSGRGIAGLLATLDGILPKESTGDDNHHRVGAFTAAVLSGQPRAIQFLDSVTRPLAFLLAVSLMIDPLIDRIVLTGGVVHGLGTAYVDSLVRQFNSIGVFQITNRDPNYLRSRIRVDRSDDNGGLIGAAIVAERARTKGRRR